jgi:hypothetical protein
MSKLFSDEQRKRLIRLIGKKKAVGWIEMLSRRAAANSSKQRRTKNVSKHTEQ